METTGAVTGQADRILIAANPRSGSGPSAHLVRSVAELLRERRFQVDTLTDLDALTQAVRDLQPTGRLRAVVAAGGDGTVAEILNRTEPGVPLAVFPLGTANLLAKYLHIAALPDRFAETVATGRICRLDCAQANGRIFFLMAGVGFDAEVVRRLHSERRGHINYLTYAKPTLSALRSYQYPILRMHCELSGDDSAVDFKARWAFIVNLPCYAGGLQFAPDAVGTDGLLNVCTFSRGSFWNSLRYLGYVLMRRHPRIADCRMGVATRMRIESDAPVPYQLDGDPGGMLPLEIEMLPGRLTLVVPEGVAAARGWPDGATIQPVIRTPQG